MRDRDDAGKDNDICLNTTLISKARVARDRYKAGLPMDPDGPTPPPAPTQLPSTPTTTQIGIPGPTAPAASAAENIATVRTILTRYVKDGYPDKKGIRREDGPHLDQEKAAILVLDAWFKEMPWDKVTQNVRDQNHDHRVAAVNPTGDPDS